MVKRYEGTGRMSRVVVHNDIITLCGQVGSGDTIQEQAEDMLSRVDTLLEKYGSDRKHMISAQVFLSDMKYFNEFNAVWDNWVIDGFEPTRACVEGKLARESLLCEVIVTGCLIK